MMSTAQDKRQLAHLELLKSEIASGAVAPPMMDAAEALLEKTILRHDVVTASYVESCGTTGDAAAADFIRQLQPACVKRGQVLSIDSGSFDSNEGKKAVFCAHYSLEMADEGPLCFSALLMPLQTEVDFKASSSSSSSSSNASDDRFIYLFHYKDTGKKRDLGKVSYVESRGDFDAATADIIRKLQAAGVKRGQVLSIDAQFCREDASNDDAFFSAHYSLELADEGPLEVELIIKRMGDKNKGLSALYKHAAETAVAVGISKNILALTFTALDGPSDKAVTTQNFKGGAKVVRGPDWKWKDQDGGAGNTGILAESLDPDGWVSVRWECGSSNKYRVATAQDLMYQSTSASKKKGDVLYVFHYKEKESGDDAGKFNIDVLDLVARLPENAGQNSSTDILKFPFSADVLIRCTEQNDSTAHLLLERTKLFSSAALAADALGLQHMWALEVGDRVLACDNDTKSAPTFVPGSIVSIVGEQFIIKLTDSTKLLTVSASDVGVDLVSLRSKLEAVAQESQLQLLRHNALHMIELCESLAFTPTNTGMPASTDAAKAVNMLVDLTRNRNVGTCASAVRLARNILQNTQSFKVSHIHAFFSDSPDAKAGLPKKTWLDAMDHEVYALLVRHIQAEDGALPLMDSAVPVTLAAVVAVFELSPGLSLNALGKIDLADLDLLLEFWPELLGDDGLTALVENAESHGESLRHADLTAQKGSLSSICSAAKYLFLSALVRLIPPSLSAVEATPLGFWRRPGEAFASMDFSMMRATHGGISALFTVLKPGRIDKGDTVSIKPDSGHFDKDKEQTGTVITDDGSSNPYIVRWSDGTDSGWLEPVHLEKVPEKFTLEGRFEGDELVFTVSSGVEDEAKTYRGKLGNQQNSLIIYGSFGELAPSQSSALEQTIAVDDKGGFLLSLGKITESMQKVQRSAQDLVSAVTELCAGVNSQGAPVITRAEEAMQALLTLCVKQLTVSSIMELLDSGVTASDKELLNMISRESPQFWGHLLTVSQDGAIHFLQHLISVAMSVESDKVIRMRSTDILSSLVAWLVSRWHPLASEIEEKKEASAVDSFVHDASATVVHDFVQALKQRVETAEKEAGMESSSLQIKAFMTTRGMREVLQMLSLLGYSIATSGNQHKETKVNADLLGWIASAASLLDRVISLAEEESVSKQLWPFCEMLSMAVGKKMTQMIWTKPPGSLVDQHHVLFAGSHKLSSAPAFENLLARDCKKAAEKIDTLVQRKFAMHMSPFLDELERYFIVVVLYHSGVLAKVLDIGISDLDDDTVALCTQASLKARQVRRNVMEIRSRHNQTLKDDEEPKPWDWFTDPFLKKCLFLLHLSPMCAPEKASGDPSSESLSKFRGAGARVIKSHSEGASSLSTRLPLQKSVSDAGWQMTLAAVHSNRIYRRLQLKEHSADKMYENIKVVTNFVIGDNDPEAISKELEEMQVNSDYHKPLYSAVAHELLGATVSLRLKIQWAEAMWAAASGITENFEHRPLNLDRADATDDILSWFASHQLLKFPKSICLECSCKDQGWGNSKGKLYARCMWSGGGGEWIEISKVPQQWSNLSLDLSMERLMDHAQTPFQVVLGFVVGGGGGHELHVRDAKLVIKNTAKILGETVWSQDHAFRPTSNLLLNRLCELIPQNSVVVRLLLALLSGTSAEEGSFLVSTSMFKNLKQVVAETDDVLTVKAIANLAASFLLRVDAWQGDGVNPLFVKYTKELFLLIFQRLVALFQSASGDSARRVVGKILSSIAHALTSMGSASLTLICDGFMDAVYKVLQNVDLDEPRLAMLAWCKMMMTSPQVSEPVTTALAIKLHGLVIACSPERKILWSGEEIPLLCRPSIAVRAEAARCLRSLASQASRAGVLLEGTLGHMVPQQDQDSLDLALVLSLAGTLDVVSIPKLRTGGRLINEVGAKILQVCKKALNRRLFFEGGDSVLKREDLRALVFSVRAVHAIRQLVAADHTATLAAQVYGDENLMKRLVEFATIDTGGRIPTRSLEEIISKTYAVLENALLVPETDRLASPEVNNGLERPEVAGEELSLADLESKFPTLVAANRFKSGSRPTQQQTAKAKEGLEWQTTGNAFALACDLEKELLALLSSLFVLQVIEHDPSVLTTHAPKQCVVLDAITASSLVTVLTRHFMDSQSPEARTLFKNGPCAKADLLTPVQTWIRGKISEGASSALAELCTECILALKQYSSARSAALLSAEDHMLCAAVVWQVETGEGVDKIHICEFATKAAASDFAADKRAQACLARVYVVTRKDSILSLERLDGNDEEHEPPAHALDAFSRQVAVAGMAQMSADNPGSAYFELMGFEGSIVEYQSGNGSDFCNVMSAKAITEGRHSFEFVVHKVGDNMMYGVTCRKDLAGTQTSLIREAKCWTYYCGRRNDASTRIAVGDMVSIKPDSSLFQKDYGCFDKNDKWTIINKKHPGKVTTDDGSSGSSNHYKVRWSNGTESSWLEPEHLEKVPCPALHLDGVIGVDQAENIKDGDIIGLVIDFSSRKIEFSKNGQKQGECCFSQDVKELYLITALGTVGDKVEVRASGVAPEVNRLLTQTNVSPWGSNPKRAPAWLKELMTEASQKPETRGQHKAGIGVALVLAESIQQAGGLSGSQISQVLEALATSWFLSAEPGDDVIITAPRTGDRLQVGAKVRLTATAPLTPDGPLHPGDVGTLLQDDRTSTPYQVEFQGSTWWYGEGTIEEAGAVKSGQLEKVMMKTLMETQEKLMGCMKAMMLSEHGAGCIEPGPYLCKFLALLRSNQLKAALTDSCNSDLNFLIAFDRRQQPEANLEQLLSAWIEEEAKAKRSTAPLEPPANPNMEKLLGTIFVDKSVDKCVAEKYLGSVSRDALPLMGSTSFAGYGSAARAAADGDFKNFGREYNQVYTVKVLWNGDGEMHVEPDGISWNKRKVDAAQCVTSRLTNGFVRLRFTNPNGHEGRWESFDIVFQPNRSEFVGAFQRQGEGILTTRGEFKSETEVPQPLKPSEIPPALPRGVFIAGLQGHYLSAQGSRISIVPAQESGQTFVWENMENHIKWQLEPEKAGDDEFVSTMGLKISPTCPFYADGHVFLMLEWKGTSVSKLHGPEGEIFEPDQTQASPAIEHVSNVLKVQMVLDAMKTRQPFPAWLVDTAKAEEEKRAIEAEKAAKAVNDEGNPVRLGLDTIPGYKGSDKYYCGQRRETCLIPGSDGQCGPTNGPQCASCLRFQTKVRDDQTGEGVYSGPSSEAWATAADNALWSMEMDQVLSLYIAQSLEESATNKRLKVGTKVRLTANYLTFSGDASGGPLCPGDVGTLHMVNETNNQIYCVQIGQKNWWYFEGTIEEAVDPVDVTLQLPSSEIHAAFAGVSAEAIAARAAILLQVSSMLSKSMQTLKYQDYLEPGSMANVLFTNPFARSLIKRAISDLFTARLTKVKNERSGEFPSFEANRGILPADQRKRRDTVFCQAFANIGKQPDKYPLLSTSDIGVGSSFWKVKFAGEGGIDYGGLFRDSLREICAELQCQGALQLLIACPNNKYAVALNQDRWILNPVRNSEKDLAELAFLGRILGASIHTKSSLELDLAPHVWKQLLGQAPTLDNILAIDQRFKASWVAATSSDTPEAWEALEREWRVYDWSKGGVGGMANLPGESGLVSFEDRTRFLEMWKAFRLSDEQLAAPQARAMRQQFSNVCALVNAIFMLWH